jgi:signal transduction histidine kinase/DNA-binding response OmpR family regulator
MDEGAAVTMDTVDREGMDSPKRRRAVPLGRTENIRTHFELPTGEMATLVRAFDWATTPLGPVDSWSPSLRMMVSFLLANRFPLLLWWGRQYTSIYNDAYTPILGAKHPCALGQPCSEVWSEIWHVIKPLIETPFRGGPATWMDDLEVEVNRHGFREESHFTVAYSPVPDETAPRGIGGVLATVHEITGKIIGQRRIAAIGDLGARSTEARSAEEACSIAADTLAKYPKDVPFAQLYLIEQHGRSARLAATSGPATGPVPGTDTIVLDEEVSRLGWPLAEAARHESVITIDDIAACYPELSSGPWADPPKRALVVPIRGSAARQLAGFLIAGVSSRLRLDDQYRSFFELAASQIATAIANARAYEEERKRAAALAEIDRAKTAFFSNVSHELRTPLTLILGPVEECAADPMTPGPVREQLELAHRNGLRLLKLVNTLLDFARIKAHRVQASYEPTDLAAMTRDLASSFRSTIERAGLELDVDCPQLDEVYVDPEMWEKIVLNLLSNAFKFTLRGRITLKLRREENDAVLRVSDTGIGIPAHELPRLFERFHRVEGAAARTQEGSGIGLALVQELVKLHGGDIHAVSEYGSGTTFIVKIPFGIRHLPAELIKAPRLLASTAVGAQAFVQEALRWIPGSEPESRIAPLSNEIPTRQQPGAARARVLLADDNADMRAYVRNLLAATYAVETAVDGEQALEAARRELPDLILADIMMPRLDGIGLVKALRAEDPLREVPVILLSARAGEEARIEGLDVGADDYLVKPFPARELLARVGARIELTRMRRAGEKRFHAFIRATSDVIYKMSPDWSELRILQGQNFLADTDDPDRSWLDKYICPDDQPRMMAVIREAIQTKSIFQLEHRVRRVDGTVGWTISRAIPMLDEAGNITEWFGAASDVTARKEAEQGLREREEALRKAHADLKSGMAELARFAQVAVDREHRIIELKEEVNRLDERLGEKPHYSPTRYEEAQPSPQAFEPESEGRVPLESISRTAELKARPSRVPDYEAENRALTTLVKALADSPRSILNTLANTALAVLRAGSAGISLLTSDGERFYLAAVTGAWSRHHADSTPRRFCPSGDVLDRNTPLLFAHWELRYPYLADATPHAEEALHVPIYVDGNAVGTVWVISHDAERKFDAEDLRVLESLGRFASAAYQAMEFMGAVDQRRAALSLLEDAVQARQQAESSNRKLQGSEEALRQADRRKNEFLALLGHELRNPISPIRMAGELLSRTLQDDSRAQAAVGMIKRQAAQLTRLVDDLLDVGRITQGRIQLDRRPLDLASVVAQAVETVEPLIREKHHELIVTGHYEHLYVSADFARLVQCLVNLLANAAKYTEPRGEIRLRTRAESSDAIIEVSDNGAGIPPGLLPSVFDLFVQGDRTLDRAQGGLGVGLSVVKRLVEMHGGRVSARSPGLGRGSTFEIRLPRIERPIDAPQSASFTSPPRRVLIVDDNADSANSLSLLLALGGHETQVALGSLEALDRIESFHPDVALLDIGLPELDGYQLAQRLRSISRLKDIRLVALTGYGQTEDRQRAFAAGFDEHLVKPVDLCALERTLAGTSGELPDPAHT